MEYWEPLEMDPSFYENEGHATYEERHSGPGKLKHYHRRFLEDDQFARGRLLDIGCGEGRFLMEARRRGYSVHGIDLDSRSVARAQERGLSNVHALSLEDYVAREAPHSFDVVTLFEVLEHQDRPIDFLRQAGSLVRSGGWIVGSVPNRERLFVEKERARSAADFPPHHFLWFSAQSLEALLQRLGFLEIRVSALHLNTAQLTAYLDWLLLDRVTGAPKRWLRRAKANRETTRADEPQSPRSLGYLRTIRNAALFPLAWSYRWANSGGLGLYYVARTA